MGVIQRTQPQGLSRIDWTNPITRGLSLAENLGGQNVDLVSGKANTVTGTSKVSTTTGTGVGFGTIGLGATDTVNTSLTTHSPQRTYFFIANQLSVGGNGFGRIFDKTVSTAQYETLYSQAGGNLTFNRGFSTTGGSWTASGALSSSRPLAITYDSASTSNVPLLYGAPGIVLVTSSSPVGTTLTNTDPFSIGNRGDGTRNFDGTISCFYVWDRILSPAEIQSISANPWQIFQPVAKQQQLRLILAPTYYRSEMAFSPIGPVYVVETGSSSESVSGMMLAETAGTPNRSQLRTKTQLLTQGIVFRGAPFIQVESKLLNTLALGRTTWRGVPFTAVLGAYSAPGILITIRPQIFICT